MRASGTGKGGREHTSLVSQDRKIFYATRAGSFQRLWYEAPEMSADGATSARAGTVVSLDERGHARVLSGESWFVAKGPVPGDKLSVVPPAQGRRLRSWALIEGAAGRRKGPCAVQEACGGCSLMVLNEAAQHSVLLERIREALVVQSLPVLAVPREVEVGPALAYRNRIRLRVNERSELTFFNSKKSTGCVVLEPSLKEALFPLLGQPFRALTGVRFVEMRARDLDGRLGVFVVPEEPSPGGALNREALEAVFEGASVHVEGTPSPALQRFSLIPGLFVYVPLPSFVQVNFAMNALLVEWVAQRALESGARSFWDLFCGVGNFSLPLLKRGLTGLGVELDKSAVDAATLSSQAQGLGGRFIQGDAGAWLEATHLERPDLIVVDAPRAGFGRNLSDAARLARRSIILVSCCPETLARDVRVLSGLGWTLTCMRAFDMFPQTHHVEVAAELTAPSLNRT